MLLFYFAFERITAPDDRFMGKKAKTGINCGLDRFSLLHLSPILVIIAQILKIRRPFYHG